MFDLAKSRGTCFEMNFRFFPFFIPQCICVAVALGAQLSSPEFASPYQQNEEMDEFTAAMLEATDDRKSHLSRKWKTIFAT